MVRAALIILLLTLPSLSLANSCCGQSPASFPVLSLHQKWNVNVAYTFTESLGRVYGDSNNFYLWGNNKKRSLQSTTLTSTYSIAERHQVFINGSYIRGSFTDSSENGESYNFSDTLLGYNFEILPEYTYSPWKPTVFISGFLNIPTGHSIYDPSSLSEGSDVTGNNQWGTGVGLTARKVFFPWTFTAQAKVLRLFPKTFAQTEVSGFYDISYALLASYASSWWSLAFTGGWTYSGLTERELIKAQVSSGQSRVHTLLLALQRPINESVSVGLSYTDQSLIGSPQNVILNKSYNLNIQYDYF